MRRNFSASSISMPNVLESTMASSVLWYASTTVLANWKALSINADLSYFMVVVASGPSVIVCISALKSFSWRFAHRNVVSHSSPHIPLCVNLPLLSSFSSHAKIVSVKTRFGAPFEPFFCLFTVAISSSSSSAAADLDLFGFPAVAGLPAARFVPVFAVSFGFFAIGVPLLATTASAEPGSV